MNASYLAGHLRFGVGSGYWSAGTAVRWGRDGWVEAGLGFVIGGPREFMRGSVGRMAMGGAGIKARGAPPDERQQPRHRADEAGPSGASGCASRVASSALVAKNRDRPIGRTNMDILKGPGADCGARALPPRAAFSKVARERGISSGRRRGLAPAVDPRDTTSASPVSPNPARDELHSRCCIRC